MVVFEQRIEAHPFVASPARQGETLLGGHLSPWNLKFRTRRNFSVLCGYTTCSTKHGDGKPRHAGQMAHLWMKLTSGNTSEHGGESNLRLLANLLCEIARFDLPYPYDFGVERLRLLASAVGDRRTDGQTASRRTRSWRMVSARPRRSLADICRLGT